MLKVMLVDDNKLALEYFSTLVDWSAYGYTLVCTATDGEAGLIEFRRHRPDLVITDVQMPNMNGIELTEKILELAPKTVVIFLSSFEEFSYVKSALKLGVYDYVLKHQTKAQDLAEKLIAVKKLVTSRSEDAHFIHEGFLNDFLKNGDLANTEDRQSLFHHFPGRYDLRFLVLPHYLPVIEDILKLHSEAISEKELKAALYQDEHTIAAIKCSAYSYLLLSSAAENAISYAYTLQQSVRALQTDISLLILAENTHIVDCLSKCQALSSAETQMTFFPVGSVLYPDMITAQTLPSALRAPSSAQEVSQIDALLRGRGTSALLCQIDEQFRPAIQARDYPAFSHAATVYLSALMTYHREIMDARTSDLFLVADRQYAASWYDAYAVYSWIKERYLTLSTLLAQEPEENYSPLVRKVLKTIYQNYSDSDLSAESIADTLQVGINQLNNQMKKETSYTVWKLLIKVRMTKAKTLLEQTDLKIADICEQTGYKSISYFSNVFRKYYGISAQEYRKTLHQSDKKGSP